MKRRLSRNLIYGDYILVGARFKIGSPIENPIAIFPPNLFPAYSREKSNSALCSEEKFSREDLINFLEEKKRKKEQKEKGRKISFVLVSFETNFHGKEKVISLKSFQKKKFGRTLASPPLRFINNSCKFLTSVFGHNRQGYAAVR